MPLGPLMVDQDVIPRELVRVMVTASKAPKPLPQIAGWLTGAGPTFNIGGPGQKLMRAELVGGTTVMGGAGQRRIGTGAAMAGGHGPHPTPSWAGRARQGRSAADEAEPGFELDVAFAAEDETVFWARAPLFWAAETGVAFNSVREAVVEQAARTRVASKTAVRIAAFRRSPRRANE